MRMDHSSLMKWLSKQDCYQLQYSGGGHWKICQGGKVLATMGSTPGRDGRAIRNTVAVLRRAGIPVPRKGDPR